MEEEMSGGQTAGGDVALSSASPPECAGADVNHETGLSDAQVAQFSHETGTLCDDARWYLEDVGGDLQRALRLYRMTLNLSQAHNCSVHHAWGYLKEAYWSLEVAESRMKAVGDFCAAHGCSESKAWGYLKGADWSVERAAVECLRKAETYKIACPYTQLGDCSMVWPVTRADLNCSRVRCGINVWRGAQYQFPRHGRRDRVEAHLQSWPGDRWRGWPGVVHGCGRPFSFPNREFLTLGESENVGLFMTWDEEARGTLEEVMGADPEGDYSRVVDT